MDKKKQNNPTIYYVECEGLSYPVQADNDGKLSSLFELCPVCLGKGRRKMILHHGRFVK